MKNTNPRQAGQVIVIVGPTASGKSALAIKVAKKFDGEIVSADSRQIYRGMDIGTAKPCQISKVKSQKANLQLKNKNEQSIIINGIPHYMIDIKNPNEDYSVAEYKRDAIKAINKIIAKGKMPILVGGTGLYISAIVDNLEIDRKSVV